MRENWTAILTTLFIMAFMFGLTMFVNTATAKASHRVKTLVNLEIHLSGSIKPTAVKHPTASISPDTSIKYVNW